MFAARASKDVSAKTGGQTDIKIRGPSELQSSIEARVGTGGGVFKWLVHRHADTPAQIRVKHAKLDMHEHACVHAHGLTSDSEATRRHQSVLQHTATLLEAAPLRTR